MRSLLAVVWRRVRGLVLAVGRALPAVGRTLVFLARAGVAPLTIGTPTAARTGGVQRLRALAGVAIAVLLYALTAAAFIRVDRSLQQYPPQVLHLLAAGCCLPVAVRGRWPLPAWQVSLVSVVVTGVWFQTLWAVPVIDLPFELLPAAAYLLCLYTVASRHPPVVAAGAWLWSLGGLVAIASSGAPLGPQAAATWAWSVAVLTVVPVFAHNVGTLRRAERALQEQEDRNRREQEQRARLEERSRIARELHDVVAHNMSVIAIQAEAAPLRSPDDAAALTTELAGIRATALQTLNEMRRVLGLLRAPDEAVETAPAPGIGQLDALIERVRAAGMDVDMAVAGTPRDVAPGVGVSVYRIVQESLSNALRHAPGARVAVTLTYRDDPPALVARVHNDPAPQAPPPPGPDAQRHGLVGMRERTAMLRGTLRAEPTPVGGFVVEATLPLEEPA